MSLLDKEPVKRAGAALKQFDKSIETVKELYTAAKKIDNSL